MPTATVSTGLDGSGTHDQFRVACRAPFVTMSFQPSGDVFACCRKPSVVLGNISRDRVGDIWGNDVARGLRDAVRSFELPSECGVCAWHLRNGARASADLATYESLPVVDDAPTWPRRLEFNLSNRCNLCCVHCSGDLSSAIRARREHLPPLPSVYGEQFFDDLVPFLAHLSDAVFLGGEPFLQPECFRIWDLLIDQPTTPDCLITTSGAIYNDRVGRVLDELPVQLSVSLDGVTPETVEAVRVGARWSSLMANLERFHEHLDGRRRLVLTFSLLTLNWHEFPDFLLFAEDHGADVWLNRVTHPPHLSLRSLSEPELDDVVAKLEARGPTLVDRLTRNEHVWEQALATIRGYARPEAAGELGIRLRSTPRPSELARLRAAREDLDAGRLHEALAAADVTVHGSDARHEQAHIRVLAHRLLGDHRTALALVEEWLRSDPGSAHAHLQRGLCHLAVGRREAAGRDLDRAAELAAPGDDLTDLTKARRRWRRRSWLRRRLRRRS